MSATKEEIEVVANAIHDAWNLNMYEHDRVHILPLEKTVPDWQQLMVEMAASGIDALDAARFVDPQEAKPK